MRAQEMSPRQHQELIEEFEPQEGDLGFILRIKHKKLNREAASLFFDGLFEYYHLFLRQHPRMLVIRINPRESYVVMSILPSKKSVFNRIKTGYFADATVLSVEPYRKDFLTFVGKSLKRSYPLNRSTDGDADLFVSSGPDSCDRCA